MSKELSFFAIRPEYGDKTMEPLTDFQEDVLGDVLQSIHLRSTLYCRAKMGAPWGFRVSGREVASFHIVTEGSCWLVVKSMEEPVLLTKGDLVILPHGHEHTMTDDPKSPVTMLEDLKPGQPVKKDGIFYSMGQGAVTTLVCGGLEIEDYSSNPLYSILPEFIHIRSEDEYSVPWLQTIVELVRVETSVNRVEAETVIMRLSELLFIQAVRAYIRAIGDRNVGWLGALKDPQIGQALALIQHQPDEIWTVESLACRVGLSRSAFSAKFRQLVGEPPFQYITRVRLTKTAVTLRTHPATLVEVATSVSYESEVAFSKAFKRYFGMAPGAYRKGRRAV
jgi:AraC-like DNA-binding protein/mannose-6-phosphate isomerase-like protein (cupin superfamily)